MHCVRETQLAHIKADKVYVRVYLDKSDTAANPEPGERSITGRAQRPMRPWLMYLVVLTR